MRNVSLNYRLATQGQESAEVLAVLVTINHPELPEPIRLSNVGANLVSRGNTFLASFLQVTIMDEDPAKLPQAKLILSNVQREMIQALQNTLISCTILLEIVRASDPDYVEASLANLQMINITGDVLTIQGDLWPQLVQAQQPGIDYCYTPSYAPGLF